MSLGCVLDHWKSSFSSQFQQGIHIYRMTIEVNRNDRLGSRGQFLGHQGWVEVIRVRVDVNENWSGTSHRYGEACVNRRQWGRDDLIPRPNTEGEEREGDCVCPATYTYGILGADVGRKLLFKGFNFFAENISAAFEYSAYGGIDLRC